MTDKYYFDYNATAPVKTDVLDLMLSILKQTGNPSSVHSFGRQARSHIETARDQVANLTMTHPNSVIFTSGATEANNAVLQTFRNKAVMVSAIEHPSVLEVLDTADIIPVTAEGVIDLEAFEQQLNDSKQPVSLISVMLVNNETGVIQPLKEIARIAKKHNPNVYIHTDASQAPGRIPIDMPGLNVDYMSLCAHKYGGPQGVGALLTAPGAKPARLLFGGGQEKRQRAGTESVASIAAMGLASELAVGDMEAFQDLSKWRDKVENEIQEHILSVRIFGKNAQRVSNTSNICVAGLDSQTQLMAMDLAGFALSNGSACSSGKVQQSHVLKAMGASNIEANSTLRLSIGWGTTSDQIDKFIVSWKEMVDRMEHKIISNQ